MNSPHNSTIAVLLTPPGRGAVASVLADGPRATELVGREFRAASGKPLEEAAIDTIGFGRWGNDPGEEVVVGRRAADRIEIHCHGGIAASSAILSALEANGATILSWQEWIARVEADPIRAAARIALAEARTERTATILLDQYHGALRREVERIVAMLEEPSPQPSPKGRGSRVDARQVAEPQAALERLLSFAPLGLHLTRPWKVVLAGPPNVGKSSLINALVGYERAIVFDQPGTTRDVVKATTALDGWPVELADTAGLRASRDPLESAGVERARQQLAAADCIVLVFDATQPFTAEDEQLASEYPQAIIVRNKCDLLESTERKHDPPAELGAEPDWLLTSAVTGVGLPELQRRIVQRLVPAVPAPGRAVPFTSRQSASLELVESALAARDTAAARAALADLLTRNPYPGCFTAPH